MGQCIDNVTFYQLSLLSTNQLSVVMRVESVAISEFSSMEEYVFRNL